VKVMLRRIHHIMVKEFIQAVRDPRLRIFLFLPPLIQLVIYGYTINFDIKHIRTGVFDESRTSLSREFIQRFGATDYFDLDYFPHSPGSMRSLLDRDQVSLILRIPWDFAEKLQASKTAPLQLVIDGTDSNAALIVGRYANAIIDDYAAELRNERLGSQGLAEDLGVPIAVEEQTWFNLNRISRFSFVPGVIAMVVMLVSIMLTALAIVREKEIGTMEQLLVAPIRPVEFMLGKTIPFVIISLVDVILVTLVAIFWFDVPFRGNPLVLLLGTLLFLFSSVGVGLFISNVCTTQQQAMMVSSFFFMPAILLSGLVFPIDNMPQAVQYVTYLNPLRYFIIVVQDVFLKGVGLDFLWPDMVGMALLGLVLLSSSVLGFRKRLG
jgi:ABC-2 type transport system permease protein